MSSASSSSTAKRPSDQEIVAAFNGMKQELQGIASKIGELEMDREEHTLVIDTIKPLPGERKCFRLVGGILMERTVKEVLPALETNQDGIKQVIMQLANQYKKKEDEMQAFQRKYDIKVVSRG
ncbi:Cochaperone prefoldin complex subunit [Sorochytrium milnesiophthora]